MNQKVTSVTLRGEHMGAVQGWYDRHEAIVLVSGQLIRFGEVDLANHLLWCYTEAEIDYQEMKNGKDT